MFLRIQIIIDRSSELKKKAIENATELSFKDMQLNQNGCLNEPKTKSISEDKKPKRDDED